MDVGAACMPVAGTWMPWAPGTDAGRADLAGVATRGSDLAGVATRGSDLAGVATTMHGNQPTGEVP